MWGALLLIASLACLETATSRGERDLWFQSNWIALALLAAAIFFIAFLWWDYRPENTSPVLAFAHDLFGTLPCAPSFW